MSLVTDCFELEPIISWGAKSYIAKTRLDKLWLGGSCLGAHEMQWWSGSRQSAVETGCTPHIWKDDEEKEEEEQFKRWWWWCRWWRFTCWSGLSVSQSQSFTTERLCFVMIFVQCARLPNDYQPRQLIKDRWQDVIAINHHLAYSQTGSAKTLWFINFHFTNGAEKPPEGLVTVNERLPNPQKSNILSDFTSFSLKSVCGQWSKDSVQSSGRGACWTSSVKKSAT